jgi:hypothetical protein
VEVNVGPLDWLFLSSFSRIQDIADRQEASDGIRRRALENRLAAEREHRAAASKPAPPDLAAEVAWLRVLTRALAELCLEKGVLTEEELRERVRRLDEEQRPPG